MKDRKQGGYRLGIDIAVDSELLHSNVQHMDSFELFISRDSQSLARDLESPNGSRH